jgi:hypothetical protein
MKRLLFLTMQVLAVTLLSAWSFGAPFTVDSAHPVVPYFDNDTTKLPDYYPNIYTYSGTVLVSMNCWTYPPLDHNGELHHQGHIIQLIEDGGNGLQDPPNPDGSPGGDDALALGNFNLMRIYDDDDLSVDTTKRSNKFGSYKYFVPYNNGNSYYLRLWEGYSEKTAPYYQDTIEYSTGTDNGGTMIRLYAITPQPPVDADFKFGPPKPRPTSKKNK